MKNFQQKNDCYVKYIQVKLNHIINDDENLQNKMRYFADYFSFANEFLGKLPDIPFDNQLSLIDKSIFQIESNFDFCSVYVTNYLVQLFTYYDKSIETENPLLDNIENLFNQFKSTTDKKQWLKNNSDFLEYLKKLRTEYEETFFDTHFYALLSYIRCKHPLKKHKIEIQYATRIIVSLFRLKGHSKDSVDTYIGRIISKNEYKFPFPPSVFKIEEKEAYNKSAKHFLENRDFDKQFEGLKNLFITEQHKAGYFIYVIENCIIDKKIKTDFKVQFNKVTFISPEHKQLAKLRKSVRQNDKENNERTFPVFFGKDKLLAYINMGYENINSKKDEGLKTVAEELLSMNQYFEGSLLVNNLHFLVYDSFDSDLWSAKMSLVKIKKTHINLYNLNEFRANPFEVLRNINSPAKSIILECEKAFLKAFANDEVEYYWIFIENIFAPLTNRNEQIRKDFVKLLLSLKKDLQNEFLFKIAIMLTPGSFNYKEENLDLKDLYTIHAEIISNQNFDFNIHQYRGRIRSLVLKDLLNFHKNFLSTANIEKWRIHFTSLLLDLYAYRNSLIHSGKINEYSRIKLTSVLPKIISRARWVIINSCKLKESLSYKELIETLTKKAST
ncbi:MAG: hypothetical protein ABI840_04665 [bacterium]